MTFRILTVCTGNICRSPIVELLLINELSDIAGVTVRSAGTAALVGHSVPEAAQRLAADHGIDASAHQAQQVNEAMIREANLILGMTREHRQYIVESVPSAMKRTFTLRELALAADRAQGQLQAPGRESSPDSNADTMRAAVNVAANVRGTLNPRSQRDLDVMDPYRKSDDAYRDSFNELVPASMRVAEYLRFAVLEQG